MACHPLSVFSPVATPHIAFLAPDAAAPGRLSSPPPSVKRTDTATQEPSSVPLDPQKQGLPAIDGPFGLKFGTPFTGVDQTNVAGACNLARPISGTVLADISDLKDRLTFEEATQRIGAADVATCLIGMNGTLAFVFVPYFGASDDTKKLLNALPDEFDRRFGRVKPNFFHTTEDFGIFGHDIQTISVMRFSWKSHPEHVEFVWPFVVGAMAPEYSEGIPGRWIRGLLARRCLGSLSALRPKAVVRQ